MKNLFVRAALLCGAIGAASLAWAGPPFITDDPQPVDFMHFEVYIASLLQHQSGLTTGTLPHIEVNYGAVPNVQLHIIAPLSYNSASGQPFLYGLGDTELGVKYRFVQETKDRPMIGIFPLLEVPTGNQNLGLGSGNIGFFLPVWLQKSQGAWTVYGGGGYWHNPGAGNRDYWFSGITVQYQVTKPLMIGAELFHTTSQTINSGNVTGFNIGGVYDFDEGHHLMLSVGTGLQGVDHGTAYLAYQWTFGPHSKEEPKP